VRTLLLVTLCLAAAPARAATQAGPGRGVQPRPCRAPRPVAREDDEKVYEGKEVTCRAVITGRPEPVYPRRAREDGVQGTVRVRVVLLASGKVGEVLVIKGLPEGVSEAAVEAARRIKFTPAIKDDRWVSQRVLVEYAFNLY
jgi:protein TonB